jgi:DNA-binding XRE family transcriptional regulator
MWFDDIDIGGRGIVQPAKGPLGRALRAARHDVMLSQQQLADVAGAQQASISRLERGAPNWVLFCRLVEAIGGEPRVSVEPIPGKSELWNARDNPWLW